jgi:glucans biosynthesis protein C
MSQQREHHWDFCRAFYLLLGIPFHAAVVYSTHHDWSVASPERSPALTFIADMIHTFRMPGFFLIAGYFAMMILSRKGSGPWFANRLVRLGVPLLSATLVILPFQMIVQAWAETIGRGLGMASFQAAAIGRLTHFDEPWISHLWFLYSLIAFSAGLALFAAILRPQRFETLGRALVALVMRNWVASLLVLAAAVTAWSWMLPTVYAIGGSRTGALLGYIQYFPFFLIGVGAWLSAELRHTHANVGRIGLAIGVLLAADSMVVTQSPLIHALLMMAGLGAAWLITGFVMGFAKRHFAHPRGAVRKIADASFSIYLFHHPVIFVLAAYFAGLDWPPVLEFMIMVPFAAVVAYGFHLLVASNPVTAFLFNGVWPKKAEARNRAPLAGPVERSAA